MWYRVSSDLVTLDKSLHLLGLFPCFENYQPDHFLTYYAISSVFRPPKLLFLTSHWGMASVMRKPSLFPGENVYVILPILTMLFIFTQFKNVNASTESVDVEHTPSEYSVFERYWITVRCHINKWATCTMYSGAEKFYHPVKL